MRALALTLLLALCLAACGKLVTYEPPPEKRALDAENQAMEEAKALAAKDDVFGAHGKLLQISAASPLRSTPEFQDMENRWAKAQIAKAEAENDRRTKLALLDEVSRAPSVSGELRATASGAAAAAAPDPAIPTPALAYDAPAAAANMAKVREALDKRQLKQARALLEPRVLGGHASPEEIGALQTLCLNDKDKACFDKMADAGAVASGTWESLTRPRAPSKK